MSVWGHYKSHLIADLSWGIVRNLKSIWVCRDDFAKLAVTRVQYSCATAYSQDVWYTFAGPHALHNDREARHERDDMEHQSEILFHSLQQLAGSDPRA